jgi:hypothetical protein
MEALSELRGARSPSYVALDARSGEAEAMAHRYEFGRGAQHDPTPCLNCGKVLDAAMGVGHGRKPRPGCITICIGCGHIQAYGSGMKLRELTDEEMIDVAGNETILAIQKARGVVFPKA